MDKNLEESLDCQFEKYANEHNLICNYKPFNFVVKKGDEIIGILTGQSLYDEVHVGDLIVSENQRGNGIGTALLKQVEEFYKDKGFRCINLTTYEFQAPKFYKKCGFELEFKRENKDNPKLTKYFFIKYF